MSNPPSLASKTLPGPSKTAGSSSLLSPASSQTPAFFSNDSGQRRSGSAAGTSKSAVPRNQQSSKGQHKTSRRPGLTGDDEMDVHLRSRKGQTNITHLMSFATLPRPQNSQHQFRHGGPRQARRNPTWGLGSGYHAVDKARYVHANYRFIVDPRADYYVQSIDADVHLDWSNVLQIIASEQTQSSSCPICLGTPVAPRMAKCGHIFCLPCLIRYMHSEDSTNPPASEKRPRWKKCPICWDSIYVSETRPVRWFTGQEGEPPREGGDVVLRLVKRSANSTLAMPRESAEFLLKDEEIPWYFAADVMDYARVMKGSEEYMQNQHELSIRDLEQLEKEDELMFGEDAEWTGRATTMLREAKEKVKGIGNPPERPAKPEEARLVPQMVPDNWNDEVELPTSTVPIATATNGAMPSSPSVPRTLSEMRQRQHEWPQPSEYLFYQGLLHYYLSPLDIRILKAAFGSYNAFPSSILPRVERVSSGHVVDDDLRKRIKYLLHLPYGCEVGFLECDWTDTVSAEVLERFKPEIERRRKRHDEKEAREEKERVRAEKVGDREFAAARRKRPSIPSDVTSTEDFKPLVPQDIVSSLDAVDSSPRWANHRAVYGFASLASPSTSPTAHRTVWGTAAVTPTSPELYATLPTDDQVAQQDDGWLQGWEKDLLGQEDALVAGVQAVSLDGSGASGAGTPKSSGGKKGKKGKKITLMSTTARRQA